MKTKDIKKAKATLEKIRVMKKEVSLGLLKKEDMFGGEEVSMISAYKSIRKRKTFLYEVRKQSELKCGHGLYRELFCAAIEQEYKAKGILEGICPTMRIACEGKCLDGLFPDFEFVQYGRIVFWRKLHDVRLYISFDVTDFAKYILLTDEDCIKGTVMNTVMNVYSDYLLKVLKSKYPKRHFTQKFFHIDSFKHDKIRARMCEILSYYMEQISKKKCLARRQVKVIETMYGMPARDKDKPCYLQKYI